MPEDLLFVGGKTEIFTGKRIGNGCCRHLAVGQGKRDALAYGEVAAGAIVDAFAREDFSFATYKKQIFRHPILSQLRTRAMAARIAYQLRSPRLLGWMWKMIPFMVRATALFKPYTIPVTTPRMVKLKNEHH